MIEQGSVICGTRAFSHCCESGWGGVCSKEISNGKEPLWMVTAPDYTGYPKRMSMEMWHLCRDLLTTGTLENRGDVVFLLANFVPGRKNTDSQPVKSRAGFI